MKILHLFYDLMNLYGEYGNISVLEAYLKEQGIALTVDRKSIDDEINFDEYDFIYCGSGTEKNQLIALDYLKAHVDGFRKYINDDFKYALFTGNSLELLGNKLIQTDGKEIEMLGIIDFDTVATPDRITGDSIVHAKIIESKLVGFVNKQAYLTNIKEPLFDVEFGIGADKNNRYEGVRAYNCFGTYLIGPVLVKNPKLLCYFAKEIVKFNHEDFPFKEIDLQNEELAYQVTLKALSERKNEE